VGIGEAYSIGFMVKRPEKSSVLVLPSCLDPHVKSIIEVAQMNRSLVPEVKKVRPGGAKRMQERIEEINGVTIPMQRAVAVNCVLVVILTLFHPRHLDK
jgi:hypothetical protein